MNTSEVVAGIIGILVFIWLNLMIFYSDIKLIPRYVFLIITSFCLSYFNYVIYDNLTATEG